MLAFNIILNLYLVLGVAATLYVILFYFFTGVSVFEGVEKIDEPFRYKVSYVFIMALMFPFFYIGFIQEILNLRQIHKLRVAL